MLLLAKLYQVVQSCPPISSNTMLGICVIPIVVLCCSTHVYCAVERGVACCASHHTAIATLTHTLSDKGACKVYNMPLEFYKHQKSIVGQQVKSSASSDKLARGPKHWASLVPSTSYLPWHYTVSI